MVRFLAAGINHPRRRAAGFTLVEVIIAVLILSGGILALMRFQGNMLSSSSASREHSEAVLIAQRKIEELRAYAALATTPGVPAYADIATGTDTVAGKTGNFQRTWTVTDNSMPSYKQLDLSLTWTTSQGVNQSIALSTDVGRVHPATGAVAILPPHVAPVGLPPR